jgi:hypothetical protein
MGRQHDQHIKIIQLKRFITMFKAMCVQNADKADAFVFENYY